MAKEASDLANRSDIDGSPVKLAIDFTDNCDGEPDRRRVLLLFVDKGGVRAKLIKCHRGETEYGQGLDLRPTYFASVDFGDFFTHFAEEVLRIDASQLLTLIDRYSRSLHHDRPTDT
ncbi:MAG: hypothetical protein WC702_04280 [Patescibacteria group bacterium]|jgi:hypothetical protein